MALLMARRSPRKLLLNLTKKVVYAAFKGEQSGRKKRIARENVSLS
jgi:hypothetical protein